MDHFQNGSKIPSMAARKRAWEAGRDTGKNRLALRVVPEDLEAAGLAASFLGGFDLERRKLRKRRP